VSEQEPADADCDRVRAMPAMTREQCFAVLDAVRDCWWMPDLIRIESDEDHAFTYRVSTGGYSANEAMIAALMENRMWWSRCWLRSERGGHYTFEIPED